jgi:hypothetical protein
MGMVFAVAYETLIPEPPPDFMTCGVSRKLSVGTLIAISCMVAIFAALVITSWHLHQKPAYREIAQNQDKELSLSENTYLLRI